MKFLNASSMVEANGEAHLTFSLFFLLQQYMFSFTIMIVTKYFANVFVINLNDCQVFMLFVLLFS